MNRKPVPVKVTKGKPVSTPAKKPDADLPINGDVESGASVDKIRDILMGPQIKNYETRFVRLEETVARENGQIKDMMARRFESLEGFIKKETEALASRLKAERDERNESVRELARDLKSTADALTKKINELDNKTADAQSELRKDMLAETRKLMDELRKRSDDITALLERRSNELRADKTDRSLLAALLADMAMQISGEPEGKKKVAKAGRDD